jgi:hypothetical protein
MVEGQGFKKLLRKYPKTFGGFRKRVFLCSRFERKAGVGKEKSTGKKQVKNVSKTFGGLKNRLTFAARFKENEKAGSSENNGWEKRKKNVLKTFAG